MKKFTFYLGLSTLLTHELDAMSNHEWRVLPLIRVLPDNIGMLVFVAINVPIASGLMALVARAKPRIPSLIQESKANACLCDTRKCCNINELELANVDARLTSRNISHQ